MTNKEQIIEQLKQQIVDFKNKATVEQVGTVIEVGDGIAKIAGLADCMSQEMLAFAGGQFGVALNLEEDSVGAMILGEYTGIKEGDQVKTTKRILEVPVGEAVIGRVVSPLGEALDGKGEIKTSQFYPVEKIAPRVIARQSVSTPLQTGIKAIDSMIPIGRGQRELIIGDRQTGKTAVAIDTIINQKSENVICIYVAIGQKESKLAKIVAELKERGAMGHTIVVHAGSSDSVAMQYLAPYAAASIAEYFMDKGRDVLVIFDDLTKHAWAYRQISLILRRPAGREAYPGDVFYLHSRLLERACRLDDKYGGGSITALPIIETLEGDLSSYIPTNVISITDGQIVLDIDLFNTGIKPAINIGLSVSRVGGNAQTKIMKSVAGKLKLDLAQYRELAAFSQFESELDEETKKFLNRGARITQVLKQKKNQPYSLAQEVAIIWAASNGYLDTLPLDKIESF